MVSVVVWGLIPFLKFTRNLMKVWRSGVTLKVTTEDPSGSRVPRNTPEGVTRRPSPSGVTVTAVAALGLGFPTMTS